MVINKNKQYIMIGCLIFVLVIGLIIIIFSFSGNNDVIFKLNGQENMFIFKNEIFNDPLFQAVDSNGNDISNHVKVSGDVNTWVTGTYKVSYVLNYKGKKTELIRTVMVLDNILDNYEIKLNGLSNVYVKKDSIFNDPGYYIYDKKNNINVNFNLEVNSNVNTSNVGNYKIEYILKISGKEKKTVREVVVYSLNYSLSLETMEFVNGKLNIIFDASNESNYASIVLPNGTTSMSSKVIYPVSEIGEYRFVIYDKYGNSEERIIDVNNIVGDIKCTGTVSRYGTHLTVSGSNSSGAKEYLWNVDGVKVKGSKEYRNSLKAIDNASVILKFGTSEYETKCSIDNSLAYKFVYDENNQKPYMSCNTYTASDRVKYETILKNAVNEAGYGTRAGVVEAARFLVGGLSYKVKYLGPKSEDSRLGRYEKVGLNIGYSDGWGCAVSGWIQGMDCTNFVEWAFKQAGLDLSGVYSENNTYDVNSVINNLKVGDLLLTPSETPDRNYTHVGIIVGIDDNYIYVAEATTGNINAIVVTKLNKNNIPSRFSVAKIYKYPSEGNITNMWVS